MDGGVDLQFLHDGIGNDPLCLFLRKNRDLVGKNGVGPHDHDLYPDGTELLLCNGIPDLHGLQRGFTTVLDVAFLELLGPVAFPGDLPGKDDLTPAGARSHDLPYGGMSRPPEMPAPLKGNGELVCHDVGIEVGLLLLFHLDLWIVEIEPVLHDGGEFLDGLPAVSNDHSRSLGDKGHQCSHGVPLNIDPPES